MALYEKRPRLRDRVEARKPGYRDPDAGPPKRWPHLVGQIGFAVSMIALGLLAYEALRAVEGDMNIKRMAIYAGLFIAGRLAKTAVDAARPYL